MKLFRFGQRLTPTAVHTTGFAEAADNGTPSFGAVSPETFEQRKHIDRNRQHITKFREASIHHDYRKQHQRIRSPQPERKRSDTPPASAAKPSPENGTVVRPAASYREPQSRGFNPFR